MVTIEVLAAEYFALLRIAERVECLERMLATGDYVSVSEIMAVLDIHEPARAMGVHKNETV